MRIAGRRLGGWAGLAFCVGLAVVILGACDFQRRAENPVERRATWFSYLSGTDIQRNCWSGSAERYRLIYNARYPDHVRTYEITGLHEAEGGVLDVEVFSPRHDPTLSIRLPLWPWKGQRAIAPLTGDDMAAVRASLKLSGAFARPQIGVKLDSASYYWVVTGCLDGRFFFNGFAWPSEAWSGLAFPDIIARFDRSEIPVAAPAEGDEPLHDTLDRPAVAQNEAEDAMRFIATLTRRGIVAGAR